MNQYAALNGLSGRTFSDEKEATEAYVNACKALLESEGYFVGKWEPIEKAPMDGTFVLLGGGDTDEDKLYSSSVRSDSRPVVGAYIHDNFGQWGYAIWDGEWRSCYDCPQVFMELPQPPKED